MLKYLRDNIAPVMSEIDRTGDFDAHMEQTLSNAIEEFLSQNGGAENNKEADKETDK